VSTSHSVTVLLSLLQEFGDFRVIVALQRGAKRREHFLKLVQVLQDVDAVRMKLVAGRAEVVPSSLRDEIVWRDDSAAADGWKPTATFGGRSATKARANESPAFPLSLTY
jgi:hypothetical protein